MQVSRGAQKKRNAGTGRGGEKERRRAGDRRTRGRDREQGHVCTSERYQPAVKPDQLNNSGPPFPRRAVSPHLDVDPLAQPPPRLAELLLPGTNVVYLSLLHEPPDAVCGIGIQCMRRCVGAWLGGTSSGSWWRHAAVCVCVCVCVCVLGWGYCSLIQLATASPHT